MRAWRPGWAGLCLVALVLANDYQIRLRAADQSLSGAVDLQIILELSVYGLVGAYCLSRLRLARRGGRPHPLGVAIGLYVVSVAFAALYSPVSTLAVVRLGQLLVVVLLVMAIMRTATRADVHRMLHSFVALLLASVFLGLAMPVTYQGANRSIEGVHAGRFTWWNLHPNAAGTLLAISVVIVTYYVLDGSVRDLLLAPRGWYLGALGVLAAALVATGSRTALSGGIVGVSTVALLVRTGRRRADLLVVLLVAIPLAALLASSSLVSLAERGDEESLTTLNSRTDLWESSIEAIGESPVLGHGYGSGRVRFSEDFGGVGGSHNALLEVLVDGGVVGAAVWLYLLACIARGGLRMQHRRRHGEQNDSALVLALLFLLVVQSFASQQLGTAATTESLWMLVLGSFVLFGSVSRSRSFAH